MGLLGASRYMRQIQGLVLRSIAGAIVFMVVGLIADLVVHTQGYWFVGFMAGLIGGAMTVYLRDESPVDSTPAATEEN